MSKTCRKEYEETICSLIPELAEKYLKSPQTCFVDHVLAQLGSSFHLDQSDVRAMKRAVTGCKVTQVEFPESPSFDDLKNVRKVARSRMRAAWNRVKAIWIGLDALSSFYGIPLGSRDFRASASLMFVLALHDKLESWFKWVTCHISAWCLGNEDLPKKAFDLHPFEIWHGFRTWLRRVVPNNRRGGLWAASIGWSVLQSKRSAIAVSEELVAKAIAEHKVALTQPASFAPRILEEEVARTVAEVFRGSEFKSRVPIPSSSAHYTYRRSDQGAAACVWDERLEGLQGDYLEAMVEVSPGHVVEVRAVLPMEEIKSKFSDMDLSTIDNVCRISPVLEALKVRTITCGSELRYWRAHDLARHMRRVLASNEVFCLTKGVPLERALPFVLNSCLVSEDSSERPFFVSGDYSAATDNLKKSLSQRALREICAQSGMLNWGEYEADLVGHYLDYEDGTGVHLQENGQLMGSPLSFPILCLINAAVTRHVLERVSGRRITLRRSGMLVNGDDILFTLANRQQYRVWEEFVSLAGLSPSPGKNYFLRDYAVINSQCYRVEYDQTPCGLLEPVRAASAHPVYHLSIGNYRGQGRVLQTRAKLLERMGIPTAVGDNVNILLERAGPKAQLAFTLLLRANDNFREFGAVDWFLPRSLGGLGIHPRFRTGGPDVRKLIWADYLLRKSRSFQLWKSEPICSIGGELRSQSENEFFQQCGYMQRFGLSSAYPWTPGVRGADGDYISVSGGLAQMASSLVESETARTCDPDWVVGVSSNNLYPREPFGGSRLDREVRAAPKALRAQAFFCGRPDKDDDSEDSRQEDGIQVREWKRAWEKAQKSCPRTREFRTLTDAALREVESLLWSVRYDWCKPRESRSNNSAQ
jgi:hypothetical protein